MQKILTVTYKTIDGKLFDNEEDALKHEKAYQNIKAFKIFAYPDLTEGRNGPTFQGYLLVHAKSDHSLFVEDWCYRKYHNKVSFVMGAFSSAAIRENWYYLPCKLSEVDDQIIEKIEEDFVTKIW